MFDKKNALNYDTLQVVKTVDGKWMIGDLACFSLAGEWLRHGYNGDCEDIFWQDQEWLDRRSLVKEHFDWQSLDIGHEEIDYREVVTFGHNMFLYQEKEVYQWKSNIENDPSYSLTHRVTAWFRKM